MRLRDRRQRKINWRFRAICICVWCLLVLLVIRVIYFPSSRKPTNVRIRFDEKNYLDPSKRKLLYLKDLVPDFRIPRNEDYKVEKDVVLSYKEGMRKVKDQMGAVYDQSDCPSGNGTFSSYFEYYHLFHSLMTVWSAITESLDVEWMLFYGGLLGQYRDKDLIPWDDDIDVVVNSRDMWKLQEFVKRNFSDQVMLYVHKEYFITREHRGFFRDCKYCDFVPPVARLFDLRTRRFVDVFQYHCDDSDEHCDFEYGNIKSFRREWIVPLKDCRYVDVSCKCPNNPLEILTRQYGDFTRKPYRCDTKNKRWVKRTGYDGLTKLEDI